MHRLALQQLVEKIASKRPKPIVLRGARQVGKSYLVRMLAESAKLDLVEVNLEKTKISELENQEDFSLKRVLTEIEIATNKKISGNSLIFIDELQAQPASVNALRYFYEDAETPLKVVAAGSLLEVVLEREKLNMPVGRVDYFFLGPMTFEEFLLATNENQLLEQIRNISLKNCPVSLLHKRAVELLRVFYFVGGMPEAVRTYVETSDFEKVRAVQNSIRLTYQDDVNKYSKGKGATLIEAVLNYVPLNLGRTVTYTDVAKVHSSRVQEAISLLARANVIYVAANNRASGLPLKACASLDTVKLFFLDVGLYNAATGLTWADLFKLPSDELITKGFMAEQFVAQHLFFRRGEVELADLYYWTRTGKEGAAEVDFVISDHGRIFPLEVKSGSAGKMRSLWQFVAARESQAVVRLDLSERKKAVVDIKQQIVVEDGKKTIQTQMICLPVYAVGNLTKVLREYTESL